LENADDEIAHEPETIAALEVDGQVFAQMQSLAALIQTLYPVRLIARQKNPRIISTVTSRLLMLVKIIQTATMLPMPSEVAMAL